MQQITDSSLIIASSSLTSTAIAKSSDSYQAVLIVWLEKDILVFILESVIDKRSCIEKYSVRQNLDSCENNLNPKPFLFIILSFFF